MKKSDLKLEIKNYIYEILSEESLNEEPIVYGKDSPSKGKAKKELETKKVYKQLNDLDKRKLKTSIDQDPDGGVINLEEKNNNKTSILKKLRGE
jgi:hypothetical protein